MPYNKIKSHAKINLALNIIGKSNLLHHIESIITFVDLHDVILIKQTKFKKHTISFSGRFSKNISINNTVSKLFKILDKKELLNNKKFQIKINKKIPSKAGLGGGSMNAANILNYLIKKKMIKITNKQLIEISNLIGSDVILGLNPTHSILTSKNQIKRFTNYKRFYVLIVKPNFGCSTKDIYSSVRKFIIAKLNQPNKKMFDFEFIKKMNNSLEPIAFTKYPQLKKLKLFLESLSKSIFVRMTGSGSALVAYFQSKKGCDNAKKNFNKEYKKYWCIASKTI